MENNRRFSAENALKWKYSLKNVTCYVFAAFLLLFRASGGRSGRFSA